MILRKPYAFFIKYFKVIHLIMAFFMVLLLLQTNSFLSFLNEYLNSTQVYVIGQNIKAQVFNDFAYVYIALVLILDVIVCVVLAVKDKKNLFYIVNFVGFILVLTLYIYFGSVLKTMDQQIVDARLLMTIRDLVIICFTYQALFAFITATRFLGFDIKKFDFEKDLKDLDISETDNEEFEVNVEFDPHKIRRTFNAQYRNFKYYVKENIRMIIPVLSIIIVVISFFIYQSITGGVTRYNQNVYFSVPNYSLKVENTYVTSQNYKAEPIGDDKALVVIKISVKTTNKTEQLIFGKFALKIGKNKYYHNITYTEAVKDIGETYIKQKLDSEYEEYLLVYEIPKSLMTKKMELTYVKDISKGLFSKDTVTKVTLKPVQIDNQQEDIMITLNESITLTNEVAGDSVINFKTIEVDDIFKINYKTCITDNDCHLFYEPLQANFYGRYDKALLKIEADLTTSSDGKTSYDLLNYVITFAKITYKINGSSKTVQITKQIEPQKVNTKAYYFEIPMEVLTAESATIIFNERGNTLKYQIK